jgi:hypothetical protein
VLVGTLGGQALEWGRLCRSGAERAGTGADAGQAEVATPRGSATRRRAQEQADAGRLRRR